MIKRVLLGTIAATAMSISCWASSISVYGTGLDSGGALLAGGAVDSHWTVNSGAAYVYDGGYPIGVWDANGPSSMWISANGNTDTFGYTGTYVFQSTFDLTGLDASTAQLSGAWATDDTATAYLNGHAIGTLPFAHLIDGAFSITNSAYFVDGINTLEIDVFNSGGPTGLRVDISGTADAVISGVPEPSTWLFAATGLGCMVLVQRRRASR